MLFKSTILASVVAIAALSYAPTTEAHLNLIYPCPPRAPQCEPQAWQGGKPDYDHFRPLTNSDTSKLPRVYHGLCREKESKTLKASAVKKNVFKPGQTIKTKYEINDPHGGGHCQWAITYDLESKDPKWLVFQTQESDCFKKSHQDSTAYIDVKLPKGLKGGKAIFAWIFYNAKGNREIYTSCSYIRIDSKEKKNKNVKGVQPFIANFGKKSFEIPEGTKYLKAKKVLEQFDRRKSITFKN